MALLHAGLYAYVLGVVVLVLLIVSVAQVRGVKTKADYLVAGRSLPAFVLVFTLLSSWIGAGSLFAGAENAYRNGFAALWQPAGGWAGLLLIYFIAARVLPLTGTLTFRVMTKYKFAMESLAPGTHKTEIPIKQHRASRYCR